MYNELNGTYYNAIDYFCQYVLIVQKLPYMGIISLMLYKVN